MAILKRFFLIGTWLLLAAPFAANAQNLVAGDEAPAYRAERQFIEATLQTIVTVLQEATMRSEESGLGARLRDVTGQLARATALMDPSPRTSEAAAPDDLDELRRQLRAVIRQLEAVREALEEQESYELADAVRDAQRDLREAVRNVDRMTEQGEEKPDEDFAVSPEDGERWLRPGRYGEDDGERIRHRDVDASGDPVVIVTDDDDDGDDDRWDDWERPRKRSRAHRDNDWQQYADAFVGGYSYRWPYRRETALYATAPSIRYNRVEGLVLGIGRQPLSWSSYQRATVYGQAGYAFELKEFRATIGAEVRVDGRRHDDYGLKIGGTYRYNTDTRDSWKTSWLENTLAAFFFENDFFDYHEVEGWSLYAVQRITPYLQVSAGFRDDVYRSLSKNTGWSLFDSGGFAENPAIDEGQMQSFVVAVEGGRVSGLHHLPRGAAFRVEAELGDGIGGDFRFNRYIADGRLYVPLSRFSSLGLRLRGGLTEGDFIPLQKHFTIGGIGSARGYTQNGFLGTRMLLANAEYIVDDIGLLDDILDDFQLIGFADFAWVNAFGTDAFETEDILPTAGFGLGLDDRGLRLELAFPLRDLGTGRDPSLWLRITPSF